MNSRANEQPLAQDIVGTSQGALNDKGFVFIAVQGEEDVFLHFEQFVDRSDAKRLKRGSTVTFDTVKAEKGIQARRARITADPKLPDAKPGVVKDWPWDYGFIVVGRDTVVWGHATALEGRAYLRPGDVVDIHADDSRRAVLIKATTKWEPKRLSRYELDLDMGDPRKWIPSLRDLAVPERWDVKDRLESAILRSYVKHTYLRQQELSGHRLMSGERMCWNTGLFDRNGDDIVAEFEKGSEAAAGPAWRWTRFLTVTDRDATNWRDAPRAMYWNEPADLIYDTSKGSPTVQSDHIGDKDDRFPEQMRNWPRNDLVRAVQEAARDAVKRVTQNYKTAIPQFHRPVSGAGDGSIQLLLPLRFPGQPRPSLALAVRRDGDAYYAATVLKIEWAYTYARLLAKPDTEWLDPFEPQPDQLGAATVR